jgi:hypothetical protein
MAQTTAETGESRPTGDSSERSDTPSSNTLKMNGDCEMFNTTAEEDEIIVKVLNLAADHDLHDAKESLIIFQIVRQQGSPNGMNLSLFHQIMILGVLHAALNAGLENAAEAVNGFKRAKKEASLVPVN